MVPEYSAVVCKKNVAVVFKGEYTLYALELHRLLHASHAATNAASHARGSGSTGGGGSGGSGGGSGGGPACPFAVVQSSSEASVQELAAAVAAELDKARRPRSLGVLRSSSYRGEGGGPVPAHGRGAP